MLADLIRTFVPIDINELRSNDFYDTFFRAKKADVERISKGSGWQLWDNCPICGCQERTVELSCLGIDIVKCSSCTHRYTHKVPVNIDEVYDSEEYRNTITNLELKQSNYRMNRFGKERAEIVKRLFPDANRTVLDVGSGWGYFLHFLKEAGFRCRGIELSVQVAEISRKEFSLDVVSIPIEEYNADVKFDLITLFGVIEHVKKPVEVLLHCKRLLKEGGYILLFTPNFESVAVRIQRDMANMIYPGQHLHHFTELSMQRLCGLIKMRMRSYTTKGIDVGDVCSYSRYVGKEEVAAFLYDNAAMLQSIIDEAKCGNHMRVILKE